MPRKAGFMLYCTVNCVCTLVRLVFTLPSLRLTSARDIAIEKYIFGCACMAVDLCQNSTVNFGRLFPVGGGSSP